MTPDGSRAIPGEERRSITRAVFFGDVPHRIAGGQKSLLTAVLLAREYGLDPTLVFPAEGAFEALCRARGLRVRVLEGPPSFMRFGKALLRASRAEQIGVVLRETLPYARRFAELVDRERADVVHYNSGRGIIFAGWGAHLAGRNTVLHQRGSVATGKAIWLAAQCLADWILAVSRSVIPEIFPTMRPRTTVLYNGVNADQPILDRASARADVARLFAGKPRIDADTVLFVSLSSVTPFKGLHYLVDAAAMAKKSGVRAAYVLAGPTRPDRYTAWLRDKIAALGLEDEVALVGFVDDTHGLLCAADALVLPTVAHERLVIDGEVVEEWSGEGLPRSILEAMVAGIPSIASDTAGVAEQITSGVDGLIVPAGDASSLASAIERLARDADFRLRAGAAAHEVARSRFRIEDAARGLVRELARVGAMPFSLPRKMMRWPSLVRDALRDNA